MKLTDMHFVVLVHLASQRWRNLNEMGEAYRQKVIDLGMMEPPLTAIEDGGYVAITDEGRTRLAQRRAAQ